MASISGAPSPPSSAAEIEAQRFFAAQHTSTEALPDPDPLLRNLSRGVIEVLAGVREVDQLARWLTDVSYPHPQAPSVA